MKTSWKTKNCYAEDVLKTCLEDVLEICLEAVLETNKCLLRISLSNKSKSVSDKSIFHLTNQGEPKMHQLEPNNFDIFLMLKLKHFYFEN